MIDTKPEPGNQYQQFVGSCTPQYHTSHFDKQHEVVVFQSNDIKKLFGSVDVMPYFLLINLHHFRPAILQDQDLDNLLPDEEEYSHSFFKQIKDRERERY